MSWRRHIDSSERNEMMFRVMDRQGDRGQLAPSHREGRLTAADSYSRNTLQHPHLVSMATKWTGIPFPDQVHFQSRPASLLKMKCVCVSTGDCERVRELSDREDNSYRSLDFCVRSNWCNDVVPKRRLFTSQLPRLDSFSQLKMSKEATKTWSWISIETDLVVKVSMFGPETETGSDNY